MYYIFFIFSQSSLLHIMCESVFQQFSFLYVSYSYLLPIIYLNWYLLWTMRLWEMRQQTGSERYTSNGCWNWAYEASSGSTYLSDERRRYSHRMQSPDHEAWEKVLITNSWKRKLTGWRDSLSSQLKDREDLNAIKFLMPHFLSSFLLLFFSFPTPSFSWRLIRVCRAAVPCRSDWPQPRTSLRKLWKNLGAR